MEEEREAQNEISYPSYSYNIPGGQEETSEEFAYSPAPSGRSSSLDLQLQQPFMQPFDQQTSSSSSLSEPPMSPTVVSQPKRGRPSIKQTAQPSKAKKTNQKRDWTDDEVFSLISFWKEEESLCNSKSDTYSDRDARNKAIERIVKSLLENGVDVTSSQVQEKITSLRSYYSGQKGKERSSKASGTDEVFISSWIFMKDLAFLEDNYIPRKTISNIGGRQAPSKVQEKRKQKTDPAHILQKSNDMMDAVVQRLTTPFSGAKDAVKKTWDELFGEMVTSMLEEIRNPRKKDIAKLEIQRILMNAKYDD